MSVENGRSTSAQRGLSIYGGNDVNVSLMGDSSLRFYESNHPTDNLGVRRGKEIPGTRRRARKAREGRR